MNSPSSRPSSVRTPESNKLRTALLSLLVKRMARKLCGLAMLHALKLMLGLGLSLRPSVRSRLRVRVRPRRVPRPMRVLELLVRRLVLGLLRALVLVLVLMLVLVLLLPTRRWIHGVAQGLSLNPALVLSLN